MYKFRIEGKPIPKQSLRYTQSGIRYIPEKVKNYANKVRYNFLKAYKDYVPITGACRVTLDVACPIPKSYSRKKYLEALEGKIRPTTKPDCDNIAKNILDGLNKLAYADDKQIVELIIRKFYSDDAYVFVTVEEIVFGEKL